MTSPGHASCKLTRRPPHAYFDMVAKASAERVFNLPRFASCAIAAAALALACGCAPLSESGDPQDDGRLKQARERYVECVGAQVEKDAASPAGAEDIAVAAHARCYTSWEAYRRATETALARDARSPEERQLAHDRADAELRQVELETRRGVVDRIVERTLKKKP
jgi:hypothetical protein